MPALSSTARALVVALGVASLALAGDTGHPTVVFMTDFGHLSESVAVCKGVMLSASPGLAILDITHDVPPFDIQTGAQLLEGAVRYYPPGTAFVAVVDPGVGTERRPLAARTRAGHILVGPDNGLLSYALESEGTAEVRKIENARLFNRLDPLSTTFHGRDIFSPVGARLAAGLPLEEVGPVVRDWVRLERPQPRAAADVLRGEAAFIDTVYGNVTTNIPAEWASRLGLADGDYAEVRLGAKRLVVRFARTFGDVERGELVLYPGSSGHLEVAIREGDLASTFGIRARDAVEVRAFRPRPTGSK